MYHRVRHRLVSSVASIQARLTDKSAAGVGDYLGVDIVGHRPFDELPGCHPGTFNAVLLRLLDWATTDPTPFLCWLTGPGGTGKSAVARSFTAHLKSQGRSIAYFSFNAPNGSRNSIKSLIPTLSRQIAHAIPEFQSSKSAYNPRNSKQSFQSQFEKFISKPILQLKLFTPARRRACLPILIVIDGHDDDCDDKGRSSFLKTVLEAAPRLRRYLKFLIVSRPESNIQHFFEPTSIQDDITVVDLSTYINPTRAVTPPRPSHNSIHDIDDFFHANLSSSSATNQTTIVRLLSVILVCLQTDMSPLNPLSHIPTSLTNSDRFIESILDLQPKSLQSALSNLKALMSFRRKMTLDGRPFHDIRIIQFGHGSLTDFLLDPSRSREFHIDLKAACLTVAKGILRFLADKSRTEQRYWTLDARPAYHNCLVWCYERLTPAKDLQKAMMDYDPVDYLSLRREGITHSAAVAFFTFTCKTLRRFEDLPDNAGTGIPNHLRSHLDHHLKSELDNWVSPNSKLMGALKGSIFPDHIDWDSFRSSEEDMEIDKQREAILTGLDVDVDVDNDADDVPCVLPCFLMWMFDRGLGYAGGTVERTVCAFFYDRSRAGKYYFGQVEGVFLI